MGTRSTVLGLRVVTDFVSCSGLLDCPGREEVPGNSSRVQTVPETDTGGLAEYA